ncbi:hypothetical protein ATHL_00167 [Anaerolinea thermolimosa]|nr:hypothetical protein [Anaerolinea thermolimosa]GAP05337.1 hypothetical protein ATHL_00167 [Anaerolinea thermolimosa]
MKTAFQLFITRMDGQKVRLALLILTLVLFILGAGAPEDTGGFYH